MLFLNRISEKNTKKENRRNILFKVKKESDDQPFTKEETTKIKINNPWILIIGDWNIFFWNLTEWLKINKINNKIFNTRYLIDKTISDILMSITNGNIEITQRSKKNKCLSKFLKL